MNRSAEAFWKRQRRRYIKPWLNTFTTWKQVTYGSTQVEFKKHLDGEANALGRTSFRSSNCVKCRVSSAYSNGAPDRDSSGFRCSHTT